MKIMDIERYNEWWLTGKVRRDLVKPFKRYAFPRLYEQSRRRQITLLTGLRRVGKTTLLYQLIDELLKEVEPDNILYFTFDEERYDVKEVLEAYEKRVLRRSFEECGKLYIFLDEVQRAKDWYSAVKIFYDLYPNIKFFLSGSASLPLFRKALEYLAGRFFEVQLKPLSFKEFLDLKGFEIKGDELELYGRKVLPLFSDYLRKAGFPEIVNWEEDEEIREYVKNSVVARVILRDIPIEFGVRDFELMESMLRLIFSNPGLIFNLNSISRSLGRSRLTISNYLNYLTYGLTVMMLSNYRKGALTASRKFKKVYPAAPSLIFAYSKSFYEEEYFGKVLETYVVNALNAKYYFRKNGEEIDVIWERNKEPLPIEVKESVEKIDIQKFARILKKLGFREGTIVTSEEFGEETLDGIKIYIKPAWCTEFTFGF